MAYLALGIKRTLYCKRTMPLTLCQHGSARPGAKTHSQVRRPALIHRVHLSRIHIQHLLLRTSR